MAGLFDRISGYAKAAEDMAGLLENAFGPGSYQIDDVIKLSDDAQVIQGQFAGRPAIFKRLLTPDAAAQVAAARAELDLLSTHLPTDRAAVVPCLDVVPDAGLLILGLAPGERLSHALIKASPIRRCELSRLCGDWLALASFRRDSRTFRQGRMIRRLERLNLSVVTGPERGLIETLVDRLHRRAAALDGTAMTYAIAHGDFAPVNLHVDETRIIAFDIQGGHFLPLALTCARFLSAKDIHSPCNALFKGLNRQETEHFRTPVPLPNEDPVFWYFVGEQLVSRYLGRVTKKAGTETAQQRLRSWLEDTE